MPNPDLYVEIAAVPSRLNRMLRAGQLDLAEVSSVEYARAADSYLLLPGLALGSRGPVASVLLLSQEPVESLAGEIEAPFESETSLAMLTLLLKGHWRRPCSLRPEGELAQPRAVLRIGDRALRAAAEGGWPHVYDLGQAWQEWTGLPFVYALWVVRREAAQARQKDVSALHRALLEARDKGLADLAGCADQAAQALGGEQARYIPYFQGLTYNMGQEEAQGLQHFFDLLAAQELLSNKVGLRFFQPAQALVRA